MLAVQGTFEVGHGEGAPTFSAFSAAPLFVFRRALENLAKQKMASKIKNEKVKHEGLDNCTRNVTCQTHMVSQR